MVGYSSCLVAAADSSASAVTAAASGEHSSNSSSSACSLPEFLHLVHEKVGRSPFVLVALLRCLGRVGRCSSQSFGSRKLSSSVLTSAPLVGLLLRSCAGEDAQVQPLALVALTTMLNCSEQAKAAVRAHAEFGRLKAVLAAADSPEARPTDSDSEDGLSYEAANHRSRDYYSVVANTIQTLRVLVSS